MRLLLIFVLGIYGTTAIARVFRESPAYRGQYLVPAAAHSGALYPSYTRRILRSPGDPRLVRSRVFRNVVVNANGSFNTNPSTDTTFLSILDEPRLRAQGRFYKRAQAVPIHDVSQHSQKDSIQIAAYSYDEERHHEKKLSEDSLTMVEAHDFAKNLERTTVSVKREETTTPISTTTPVTTTRPPPPRPEFQQPPAAFAQPAAIRQVPGARTFSQTVQAGGPISQSPQQVAPVPGAVLPQPQQILPGRPPVLQPFPQQPPFPNGLLPAIPGAPALPNPIGIPPDPLQLAVPPPPTQVQPQMPPPPPPPGSSPQNIPNLPHPPPPGPQLPNQVPGVTSGGGPPLPQNVLPPRENRFEVINQQAANSSLEQLGCGFDWITNTCKDVFNIGWCGRCHDFGNIFLHDCKCIQPLVQLPPRPQQPRPALLRLL